ncbi:MAG TPA: hypothetical protein VM165_11360 [Planctomycetaceae bacterium]|nr:hypothetical protein [Planctomycetaceae bacterium]
MTAALCAARLNSVTAGLSDARPLIECRPVLQPDYDAPYRSLSVPRRFDCAGAWLLRCDLLQKAATPIKELLMLPYVVGGVLSIAVAVFARWVGFDRDRAFYPTVLIVVASYYVLFAAMSGSVETVLFESILMTLFVIAAVGGFKGSPWIIVGGLAAHGVQDALHSYIVANEGVPAWWPAWCLAYDVGAAGALAWLLMCAKADAAGVTA